MAVLHYQFEQFEAIYPFTDGNGRTGRILNILYLAQAGLLDLPMLYLSGYIIEHKTDYYAGLRRVTEEGAWEQWILFLLHAVEETAVQTHERLRAIRSLMEETATRIRNGAPKVYSKNLVELLFSQPYTRIRTLEVAGLGHRQTVSKYLNELARLGILTTVQRGREIYFVNAAFLRILTG